MHLAATANIRDVIAFPKTHHGQDLMIGAPGPVDPKQLEEVHVKQETAATGSATVPPAASGQLSVASG